MSSSSGDSAAAPAITAIGKPVGSPVTLNIGASGGSLISPDGKLELTIPAGALSASTLISIQPVTNTAPSGLGSAYQLSPEGTIFNQPVTITFHYADSDVNGSLPYFIDIAYQDSAGSWDVNLKQRILDTVAKTVSITSMHFSIWTAFDRIRLISGQDDYHESESNYLQVIQVLKPSMLVAGEDPDDPLSYTLPTTSGIPDNLVNTWSINGEGTSTLIHGFIIGSGDHVMYKAPSVIEEQTTIQVSVEVHFTDKIYSYSSGKVIATFNNLILYRPLVLHPNDLSFSLTVKREDSAPAQDAFGYGYTYTQQSLMDLKIRGTDVIIENIINNPPDTSTTAGISCYITDMDLSTYPHGELWILSGTGIADPGTKEFDVILTCEDGHSVKYSYKCCATCIIETVDARDLGTDQFSVPTFNLSSEAQTFSDYQDAFHYTNFILKPQ
jgi:hypothetical protein